MAKTKIFVWCNGCSPDWHDIVAVGEDGRCVAGHVCSEHGFIGHDMGFTSELKHDAYNAAYPDGWELEYLERKDVLAHEGVKAALDLNRKLAEAADAKGGAA